MIVGLFCSILPNFHENEVSVGGKVQNVLGSSAVKTRWKTLGLCEAHPGQNILPESTRVSKVKQKPFQKILYKKKETRSFISWSVILWSLTFLLKRSVETEHQNQQKYIFPHVFVLLWPVMQLNTPCYSFTSPWGGKKKKKKPSMWVGLCEILTRDVSDPHCITLLCNVQSWQPSDDITLFYLFFLMRTS